MDKAKFKLKGRKKRQARVRGKIFGTTERPRISVYRSNTGIYAQVIDDNAGKTMVSASTMDKELKGTLSGLSGGEAAAKVGELLAQRATGAGIKRVVFDRGGRLFHGRVKALADAARAGGLEF
jgi:large subunit ribosomal protein L18